ncbi:MAG: DUF2442 domain-containing protein [Legionellales bacterium]|jgi:hypothetical protein
MKLKKAGTDTSPIEVVNISSHGFWIFLNHQEYFLSFNDFPWFTKANIEDILCVELLENNHIFWPNLDVDLNIDMIEHPEKYPFISKS